jgi:hypothetical protein
LKFKKEIYIRELYFRCPCKDAQGRGEKGTGCHKRRAQDMEGIQLINYSFMKCKKMNDIKIS